MAFIYSRVYQHGVTNKFSNALDVFVKTPSTSLEESFRFSDLEAFRSELMDVISDIDHLFKIKSELDDFNKEQFGSSEGR